jgi:hypothetical protein
MIDLPIGKAIIAVESPEGCTDYCDLHGRCCGMECGDAVRADGKYVNYRVIDLPRPVDVTPLLDALKKYQLIFWASSHNNEGISWEQRKENAQAIAAVLEQWEADHARD